LRDHAPDTRGARSRHEVERALRTNTGVASERLAHVRGIQTLRQIGQLIDHDLGRDGKERAQHRGRIVYVEHDRPHTGRFELRGLCF